MEVCGRMKDGKNKSGNDERRRKKGRLKIALKKQVENIEGCVEEAWRENGKLC